VRLNELSRPLARGGRASGWVGVRLWVRQDQRPRPLRGPGLAPGRGLTRLTRVGRCRCSAGCHASRVWRVVHTPSHAPRTTRRSTSGALGALG
jgi:hypothetical protein